MPDSKAYLNKLDKVIQENRLGDEVVEMDANQKLDAYLQHLQSVKEVTNGLYADFRKTDHSFLQKIKNSVLGKIANVVRNTVERSWVSQQKFNNQTAKLLELLINRIDELEAEVKQMRQENE